jgi:hypothetical protein
MAYLPEPPQRRPVGPIGPQQLPAMGAGGSVGGYSPMHGDTTPGSYGYGSSFPAVTGFLQANAPQAVGMASSLAGALQGQYQGAVGNGSDPAQAGGNPTTFAGLQGILDKQGGPGYSPGTGLFDTALMRQSSDARNVLQGAYDSRASAGPPSAGAGQTTYGGRAGDRDYGPKPYGGPRPDTGGIGKDGGAPTVLGGRDEGGADDGMDWYRRARQLGSY